MDPFLTTYRRDFYPKRVKTDVVKGTQEFSDPLGESFKNYLQLSSDPTSPEPPVVDADTYLHLHEENHPKLARMHFKEPINNEVMTKTFIYNGRTVYQIDYCDLEKDNAYKEELRKKNMFRLPDDWDIPLTSQRYAHRDPVVINPQAMEPPKRIKVANNLEPQPHIRKILNVTTGKSEYMGMIGDLGELIMNEELHGKVVLQ
ncbi:hypothetical protein PPYR_08019 [Photinus pyralis]|uniref:Uncharacterized protein n=2 Tax=Photinus pyralis TaxID=7054 RepID=A0A5N4ASA9_PHOPY|nr:uncharacterized protein LOC116167540 [Photinus pyralis]XP_031342023.1 uncharacterized protein LOC116169952 [Photinus pyralis]KAB0800108.1 hypothetical protein PPYR_07988 [Photinus pyralis]KAB0800139.1 hypothetical protein PPYR_08019 [Photinus pyralis]